MRSVRYAHRLHGAHWLHDPDALHVSQPMHDQGTCAEQGAATAEYAMGVVAAVLVAALLLALVFAGFFDDLLRSVFERSLDLAVEMFASAASGDSLPGLVAGLWSTATGGSAGFGWDALVDGVGDVASTAVSVTRSAWSAVTGMATPVLDAAGVALRWAGGPISGVLR